MEQCSGPQDNVGVSAAGAKRPQVIAAEDGAWAEKPPPDLQPQFRCIRHGRGTVIDPARWAARGASGGEGLA